MRALLGDLRAMRWHYWRYVLDASTHTWPWRWLYPRAARRVICDWYEAWLTRE